jgi:hypothetical protein
MKKLIISLVLTSFSCVMQAQIDTTEYEKIDKYLISSDDESLSFVSNLVYISAPDFLEDDGYNDTIKTEKVKKTDFAFFDISKNNNKNLIAFTACLIISRFDCKLGDKLYIYDTELQKMVFISNTQNYQSLEFIKKDNSKSSYFKELVVSSRDDDDNCLLTKFFLQKDTIIDLDVSVCGFLNLPLALLKEIQKSEKKEGSYRFFSSTAENISNLRVKKKWKKKVCSIDYLDKKMTFICDKNCINCKLINSKTKH